MSDTPRTDEEMVEMITGDGPVKTKTRWVHWTACAAIERQLNTVTSNALALSQTNAELRSRIRRLEEAGDAMLNAWLMPEDSMEYSDWVCLSSDAKSKWYAAKEAKP